MFRSDDGRTAVNTLEYLLKYNISENSLHQSAAMLAQIQKVSVTEFCNKSGYFVFEVLQHLLFLRGMQCKIIKHSNVWTMDHQCLVDNPAVVGIINTVTLNPFVLTNQDWKSLDSTETVDDMLNAVVVLKMWQPLQQFYIDNSSFYITTDLDQLRHEHYPTSSWKTTSVSYENLKDVVKKEIKKQRKSQIMMSNNKEIVVLSPALKGWESKTILNYECINIEKMHQKIAEALADIVVAHIHQTGNGWNILTHALFSCFNNLNGQLPLKFFDKISNLTEEELLKLRDYQNGLDNI
jgi:hypothetical protein|tara:strand:+ start:1744 stop:2625 length:882 start_codon:yes stop_codon:yes gene_type:complete